MSDLPAIRFNDKKIQFNFVRKLPAKNRKCEDVRLVIRLASLEQLCASET